MEQIEQIKAFFARRRKLTLLLAAGFLVLFAFVFKKYELKWGALAEAGVGLTRGIQHALERQQPGEVVGRYLEVIRGHCSYDPNCGPHDPFSMAFGVIKATPLVSLEIWRTGNWFSRLVLIITIGLELLMIYGAVTDRNEGVFSRVVMTVFMVLWIPVLVSLIFWVILHVLIVLTWVIGVVLSGIVMVIATFGGAWECGKHLIEVLKKADHLEDKSVPFFKKVLGIKPPPAPAAAPPATPPASGA